MIKKMVSRPSVLAVLIVFLAACSERMEYTNVIPAGATAVASIGLKSLASKARMDDKENEAAKQKLLEAVKGGTNTATFQQLEKMINNSGASNLDPEAPIYIFNSPQISGGAFVAKINNEDDLHISLDVTAKERIRQSVSETNGYSFTVLNGNLLALNETTAIIISANRTSQTGTTKEATTRLMKQTADNSITKSGAFQKITKQKSDINFFAPMSAIPSTCRGRISMRLPSEIRPEDIIILGGLSFEKGKIALKTGNYTEDGAVKALLRKQMESFEEANDTLVRYSPAFTLMFISMGVKGDGLYNLLSENKEFRSAASIAKADGVKELFNSFNDGISAGLINVIMNSAPTSLAYADVKDGNALETLYKNKQSLGVRKREDIMELGKDGYVYKTRGVNIFFGIKDKQMYATNDELPCKSIGKTVDKLVKDAPYAADMRGKTIFMAINAEAILDLPVVRMLVGFEGKESKTYSDLAFKISYLSVSSEGGTSETGLCLKGKDVNALKQIIDFARQFTGM